jgi:hypothetical protein
MERDSFYITLLSNASLSTCPDNTAGNFTNVFENAKRLYGGAWEVGLKQIQFTPTWTFRTNKFSFVAWYTRAKENVRIQDQEMTITEEMTRLTDLRGLGYDYLAYDWVKLEVPSGVWPSYVEFGQHIASLISRRLRRRHPASVREVTFFRDETRQTSDFVVTGAPASIAITTEQPEYMRVLGIAETLGGLENSNVKLYLFDRNHENKPMGQSAIVGFTDPETVFVYCDICEEQIVAENRGNLLQLVPVTASTSSSRRSRQCIDYDAPAYIRVKPTEYMPSIKIILADIDGQVIPFIQNSSYTSVRLHFRRCAVDWV